jgi:hypothetical protein
MQPHFKHALPDHCRRLKVSFGECQPTSPRRQGLPPQPLAELGQQGGAIGRHALDGFHNRLDPNNIEVRIQVSD